MSVLRTCVGGVREPVGLSGGFGVAGNGLAESDSVTVGGENQKFALSVSLVDWAIDVAIGKRV
jgi:hypothetical protein